MSINRNFFLLWQGVLLRSLGGNLLMMVGVLWLVEVANSATLVGSLMMALGVSSAVSTLLVGVIGDRFSRRNILLIADLFNSFAVLGLVMLFAFLDTSLLIIGLFFTYVLVGLGSGIFTPIVYAFLPDLVQEEKLAKGNAILNITLCIAQMLGRALIGLLFVFLSAPVLLIAIAVSFLYSAFSVLFMRLPVSSGSSSVNATISDTETLDSIMQRLIIDLKEGYFYILADRGMTKAFFLHVGSMWCLNAFMVNAPFLVQYHFGLVTTWYGYILACLSVGFVAGSFLTMKQFNQLSGVCSRICLLKYTILLMPCCCITLVFIENVYIAFLLIFLQGIAHSIIGLTLITQLQITVPKQLRGRALSVFTVISTIVAALSSVFIGFLIDAANKDVVLVQWVLGIAGCLLMYPLLVSKTLFSFMTRSSEAPM